MSAETFGIKLRTLRLEKGLSLRSFCKEAEEDPGNLSRIERGIMPPPDSPDKLKHWAEILGISRTEEVRSFMDLADIARGNLPTDLLEEEVANKLPLVFRTIRGEQVTEETLKKIAAMIKEN